MGAQQYKAVRVRLPLFSSQAQAIGLSLHFSAVSPQTLPKKSKEFGERTVHETKRQNKQAMRALKVPDSSYIFRSVKKEIRD